jgi:hypothetical protein
MTPLSTPQAAMPGYVYGESSGCNGKLPISMKWLKRLLYLIALVLLAIIAFALVGIPLYRGTPSWYRPRIATTQQIKDAANSADQKLLDLFSWAASAQARQLRRIHGISSPDDAPLGPKTVTFTEDEVNSFIASWKNPDKSDLERRISRYFTDGRVVFDTDALILAGQSPAFGTLASAQFDPSIDAHGNLNVTLDSILAGRLPIPQVALARQLRSLQFLLQQQLALQRPAVAIDSALTANASALAASWLRLLLTALNDQTADPILIIPFNITNLRHGLPVKLTAIRIVPGQITLTLTPLAPEDRPPLLERLRQPWP